MPTQNRMKAQEENNVRTNQSDTKNSDKAKESLDFVSGSGSCHMATFTEVGVNLPLIWVTYKQGNREAMFMCLVLST